jgi:hypothetical protein
MMSSRATTRDRSVVHPRVSEDIMATKKADEKDEKAAAPATDVKPAAEEQAHVADAQAEAAKTMAPSGPQADTGPLTPSDKQTGQDPPAGSRAGGTVANVPADADIVQFTGTLGNEYAGEAQSGTAERTPITGEPEVTVEAEDEDGGADEDAGPRIGPNVERERQEKDAAAKRA